MALMERKNIKKMIKDGEMVVGLTCQILDPAVAEIAGIAGFDYIRLEGEHLRPDWSDIRNYALAADSVGIPLIIRVNDLDDLTAINDLGIAGYQIPHVQNAEQAKMIVDRIRYAPKGIRGFSRFVRAQKYGYTSFDEYENGIAEDMLLIVQIEDAEGLRNMEEIIAVDGIDVICSGKGDISQALGILGDMKSDLVRAEEEKLIKLAKKYGKKLMILGRDKEDWINLVSHDCCTITEHVCDVELLLNGAIQARKEMQFLKDNKDKALK